MLGLGFVLLFGRPRRRLSGGVREISAVFAIVNAFAAPAISRLVDRLGQQKCVLRPTGCAAQRLAYRLHRASLSGPTTRRRGRPALIRRDTAMVLEPPQIEWNRGRREVATSRRLGLRRRLTFADAWESLLHEAGLHRAAIDRGGSRHAWSPPRPGWIAALLLLSSGRLRPTAQRASEPPGDAAPRARARPVPAGSAAGRRAGPPDLHGLPGRGCLRRRRISHHRVRGPARPRRACRLRSCSPVTRAAAWSPASPHGAFRWRWSLPRRLFIGALTTTLTVAVLLLGPSPGRARGVAVRSRARHRPDPDQRLLPGRTAGARWPAHRRPDLGNHGHRRRDRRRLAGCRAARRRLQRPPGVHGQRRVPAPSPTWISPPAWPPARL